MHITRAQHAAHTRAILAIDALCHQVIFMQPLLIGTRFLYPQNVVSWLLPPSEWRILSGHEENAEDADTTQDQAAADRTEESSPGDDSAEVSRSSLFMGHANQRRRVFQRQCKAKVMEELLRRFRGHKC